MMTVRPFQDDDEPAVVALWHTVFDNNRAWREPALEVARKRAFGGGLFFVATIEPDLVGTALGGYDGHRGWIYRVAVHPDHRRKGIGRRLVRAVEEALAAAGCPKINLQVEGDDPQAVPFYERLGFSVENRVSMGKPLS